LQYTKITFENVMLIESILRWYGCSTIFNFSNGTLEVKIKKAVEVRNSTIRKKIGAYCKHHFSTYWDLFHTFCA